MWTLFFEDALYYGVPWRDVIKLVAETWNLGVVCGAPGLNSRAMVGSTQEKGMESECVCEAPKGRMRPCPQTKGATKLKKSNQQEFPPGQKVLYPKGREQQERGLSYLPESESITSYWPLIVTTHPVTK